MTVKQEVSKMTMIAGINPLSFLVLRSKDQFSRRRPNNRAACEPLVRPGQVHGDRVRGGDQHGVGLNEYLSEEGDGIGAWGM